MATPTVSAVPSAAAAPTSQIPEKKAAEIWPVPAARLRSRLAFMLADAVPRLFLPVIGIVFDYLEYSAEACVVVVLGSVTSRAGFEGNDAPHAVFPTVVGLVKKAPAYVGLGQKDAYVGEEALGKGDALKLIWPITEGVITNRDQWERVWHRTLYYQLTNIAPEDHPLLIGVHPLAMSRKAELELILQANIETFNMPAICLVNEAELCMLAVTSLSAWQSHTPLPAIETATGVVLDCGETSYAVAVHKGRALPYTKHSPLGGRAVRKLLEGFSRRSSAAETDALIKQCFVALDYEAARVSHQGLAKLLDAPEVLFTPARFDKAAVGSDLRVVVCGLHQLVYDCIMRSDPGIHKDLFANIVLAGGCSLIRGFAERLTKELQTLVADRADKAKPHSDIKINVVALPNRQHLSWIGGSILASLPSFGDRLVYRHEYEENGPAIVHSKCF